MSCLYKKSDDTIVFAQQILLAVVVFVLFMNMSDCCCIYTTWILLSCLYNSSDWIQSFCATNLIGFFVLQKHLIDYCRLCTTDLFGYCRKYNNSDWLLSYIQQIRLATIVIVQQIWPVIVVFGTTNWICYWFVCTTNLRSISYKPINFYDQSDWLLSWLYNNSNWQLSCLYNNSDWQLVTTGVSDVPINRDNRLIGDYLQNFRLSIQIFIID